MTVVRADWISANRFPEKTGPEMYAPPVRRNPEPLVSDPDPALLPRRRPDEADQATAPTAGNLDSLIQRVAGASMDSIDDVIRELESLRELSCTEGERVSREIAGYASLSHASMTAMKAITETLRQLKDARV